MLIVLHSSIMFVLPEEVTLSKDESCYEAKGQKLPRVSSILDHCKDKESLDRWVKRVGHAAANEKRQNAANLGKRIHKALELFNTDRNKLTEFIKTFSTDERKVFSNYSPWKTTFQYIATEKRIVYFDDMTDQGCAGTFDGLGFFPDDVLRTKDGKDVTLKDQLMLIDYKNYAKHKNVRYLVSSFLQLAAYTLGENQQRNHNDEESVNHAMLVVSSKRQLNLYYLNPDILEFYQQAFINCLNSFYFKTKFDWNALLIRAGFGWNDHLNIPIVRDESMIPCRLYFKEQNV